MPASSSPAPGSPFPPSLSITSPEDILSYVPHTLGFVPRESLVVLTTATRRLGATLRVDLPSAETDASVFGRAVLSFLAGDTAADGTLLIVYTTRHWLPRTRPPFHDLVLGLDAVLTAAQLPVRAGWLVSREIWRDYFCTDEQCCPWPGNGLDSVAHSLVNTELVFDGSSFEASAPDAVLRESPALSGTGPRGPGPSTAEDARARYAACCGAHWQDSAQFEATSAVWDAVVEGEPPAPGAEAQLTGFLLASIESRAVRDFLLVSACLGSAAALAGARACGLLAPHVPLAAHGPGTLLAPGPGEDGCRHRAVRVDVGSGRRAALASALGRVRAEADPPPEPVAACEAALRFTEVLAGQHAGSIQWVRVDAMARVLARLVEVATGEPRAAALTMSAWFEYARGRGSRAAVFLDAAERAVPGYRLARLLHELLQRGGLPVWARSRATAWTSRQRTPR